MNYIFLPSLQHAAIVSAASLLYHDQEIENMLKEERRNLSHIVSSLDRNQDAWVSLKMKIEEKLSSLLPATFSKRVSNAIRHMHDEVKRWKKDHEFLLNDISACSCKYLSWKTDGTINRPETARELVKNDSIDSDIRFITACTYFLQDEILTLWKGMKKTNFKRLWGLFKESEEKRITRKGTNSAVRFWITWLEKDGIHPWHEIVEEFFGVPSMEPSDIPLRLSCFYHLLSWRSKENYFFYIIFPRNKPQVHTDDFQICLNGIDETQRYEMLDCLFDEALKICLRWPFRSLFIKMAEDVFRYYSEIDIGCFLETDIFEISCHLLHSFIYENNDDFYLFEEFWQMCPAVLKEEAKEDVRYLSITIFQKENAPEALKTILRNCFLI